MKVRVKFKVSDSAGDSRDWTFVTPVGMHQAVSLPTPYLLSAGQEYRFAYEVAVIPEDGQHRPLVDILAEAVQHGKDNPTHGGNCACLDGLVREIKRQIYSVVPSSADEPDWERRTDARWRVTYLLNAASRYV